MMEVDSVATPAVQQEDEDLYLRMKELQNKLEMIEIQEDYIKTELNHLKAEEIRSKEEILRIQSVHMQTGNFIEMVDQNYAIIGS